MRSLSVCLSFRASHWVTLVFFSQNWKQDKVDTIDGNSVLDYEWILTVLSLEEFAFSPAQYN